MFFEVKCNRCGKPINIDFDPSSIGDEFIQKSLIGMTQALICDECSAKVEQEEREKREEEWKKKLPELYRKAGIPYGFTVMEKQCRQDVATTIWMHRNENILITGKTGAGKTTCVCRVLMRLIQNGAKVKYMTLRTLIDDIRDRRMRRPSEDDDINQVDLYYDALWRNDFVCIDEIIGKVRENDNMLEVLFDFLDKAYSEQRCHVWVVGNVREDSIESMYGDESSAVLRRLVDGGFRNILIQKDKVIAGD